MINVYEFLRYQPELYRQFSCRDALFVYYYCPQTIRKVDVFTHYNILSFVMEGRKLIHRPENTWLLEEKHSYFFKTGAYNQELYLDEAWRSMNLYIPDSYLRELISAYRQQHPEKRPASQPLGQITELSLSETTCWLSGQLLACFNAEVTPTEDVLESIFRNLFFSILDHSDNQGLVAYIASLAQCSSTSLYDVMETNFMYNLSQAEFAKLATLSLPTFKRAFRKLFGTTPAQWLMQRRLAFANGLLKTTEKSISEVVQESGFESQSHFSRVFKAQFGEPPLQYRRQLATA
ncbi:MAG: helix-turn-helix transcriptional regulator [Spirosoma sp.]|nr:helix-turn-helix transcriptional regulator [Spirosoma sp.]